MLKHVSTTGTVFSNHSIDCSNSNRFVKFDSVSGKSDTISLNSSVSSNDSSSSLNDSSDSTQNVSLSPLNHHNHHHHHIHHHRPQSWDSSSLHSFESSLNESPKVVIKIFTRVLCTDVEYKTLSIYNHTTCKEIVETILRKFRLQHRDPNLFYLTLEAWIKQTGIPIRSVMTLEDDACPALLQSCYRQKDLKFTLLMRRGENIKVYHRNPKCPTPLNILISEKTNVEELVKLTATMLELPDPSKYDLYECSPSAKIERQLARTDLPVAIKMDWPSQDFNVFQLRPSINYPINPIPKIVPNILHSDVVDNFKKNFKTEFMNFLPSSIQPPPSSSNTTKEKVLYI